MILIIGGAYQGKLDYAYEKYILSETDVNFCDNESVEIDFSKKIIYSLDNFIYALLDKKINPIDYFNENLSLFSDKIIICNDISCGVVPISPTLRKWREAVGRSMALFSKNSESVTRLFCGIPTEIYNANNN